MKRKMLITAVMAGFVLSACGGTAATTTTAAPPQTTAASASGVIEVTLADVDANTMLMTLSSATAPAGTVTFRVTNSGNVEHEFVVLKTELALADLPYDEAADEITEDAPDTPVVDEIEGVQPGETKELTVDLSAGHYALICNLEGHFRMGMKAEFDAS
jgi:uncharacterized cupredoxin-like copper-binding protein